jgi:SAM-dependent MidA family methyltransferase
MDVTPMLRRPGVPAPDAVPPPSDPALLARIVAEIETTGPMTFARFMELALYDPAGGYYRRAAAGPGREGDFLTAPEMHPLFGATLARVVTDTWRAAGSPSRFAVVEYGAGSGALAASLLDGLADEDEALLEAVHYVPLEVNVHRQVELSERLAAAGFAHLLRDEPPPAIGIALANEYLDALPVHVVEQGVRRLLEVFIDVGPDGGLVPTAGTPSTPDLAARLLDESVSLSDGQRAEICLGLDAWAADAANRIERGVAIVIDYGAPAAELYVPSRSAGTLMAYSGHRAHGDPLVGIGHQDLTAHVDLTAVEDALAAAEWRPLGHTSQAAFLVGAGMEEVLARFRARAADLGGQLALRSAAGRLLDPRATGAFRVLAAARDMPDTFGLPGFAADRPG